MSSISRSTRGGNMRRIYSLIAVALLLLGVTSSAGVLDVPSAQANMTMVIAGGGTPVAPEGFTCTDADSLCETFGSPGSGGYTDDDAAGDFDTDNWIDTETNGTATAGSGKLTMNFTGAALFLYNSYGSAQSAEYVYLDDVKVTAESFNTNGYVIIFQGGVTASGSYYGYAITFQDNGSSTYSFNLSYYDGAGYQSIGTGSVINLNTAYDLQVEYHASGDVKFYLNSVQQGSTGTAGSRQSTYPMFGEAFSDAACTFEVANIKVSSSSMPSF